MHYWANTCSLATFFNQEILFREFPTYSRSGTINFNHEVKKYEVTCILCIYISLESVSKTSDGVSLKKPYI